MYLPLVRLIAAFTKGEDWLEELREYLFENRAYMTDYIRKEIPQLKVTEADATYLLWVDCNALGCSAKELADTIQKTTGLYVSEGAQYGKTGEQFLSHQPGMSEKPDRGWL